MNKSKEKIADSSSLFIFIFSIVISLYTTIVFSMLFYLKIRKFKLIVE